MSLPNLGKMQGAAAPVKPKSRAEIRKLEFYGDCMDEAMRKIIREYCYDKIKKNPYDYIGDYIPKDKVDSVGKWLTIKNGNRYAFAMFTINFKEGVELSEAIKKVNKCVKKVWIDKYLYCYEVRNGGHGLHVHLKVWINKDKKVYDCKREVYNTFKNLVGNKLHVNVKYSNRVGCFDPYIHGYKEGKLKECFKDTLEFRVKNNLEAVYGN